MKVIKQYWHNKKWITEYEVFLDESKIVFANGEVLSTLREIEPFSMEQPTMIYNGKPIHLHENMEGYFIALKNRRYTYSRVIIEEE